MLKCWSQPRWKICVKRTPRSINRRANRQLDANDPGLMNLRAIHLEDMLGFVGNVR